jgi:hypothetical protein
MRTITATELIVSKVQKLLRLSTANSNAEEAASAAAKAQQLIDEYNLSAAMLTLDDATPTQSVDEPIRNFDDAPLHKAERLSRWRGQLAMTIAEHNGCKVWRNGGNLMIIGRPSDAETVRYLFAWLERGVERLASTHGAGYGKSWRDNFRLGVVETIAQKLIAQHTAFTQRAQASAENPHALMRVNQALATVADRVQSVERWQKANLKLRKGSAHRTNYDAGARAQGRVAGQSITIGGAKRVLVNGRGLKA